MSQADFDTARRVYLYLRDHPTGTRFVAHSSEVCRALGITRRTYVSALKLLLEYRFLTRSRYDKQWIAVMLATRTCACGAEITPEDAVIETSRGRQFVRNRCRTCRQAQWAAAANRHRQTFDQASYLKTMRLKRALKQQGASA